MFRRPGPVKFLIFPAPFLVFRGKASFAEASAFRTIDVDATIQSVSCPFG
jgi:hypothetical protein